ncbi:MAG: ATP-binding protein [Bacteroidota bacterium]
METRDYVKRFRYLRNRLILLFTVAGVALTVTLISVNIKIASSTKSEENISSLINISGRQRMLSQSIAKLALILQSDILNNESTLTQLDSLLDLFEESHDHLLSENYIVNSNELNQKFDSIQPIFERLCYLGEKALKEEPNQRLIFDIINVETAFVPIMDSIVREYESLSNLSYSEINKNIRLSNFSIIALVLFYCILASIAAIRIVKNYSSELSSRSEELRETQVELEKSKVKEQFAFIASHDLQEPIRNIISLSEFLNNSYSDQLNEDGKQIVNFIKDSSQRMSRLIKGLLDYSRLGKNQELQKVDVNEVINDIQKDLKIQIETKNVTIKYGNLPIITGYHLDIYSLFQNLISNAIKFSKSHEVLTIAIEAQEDSKYWYFQVLDNGIGIDPKNAEKIFQLFQRLNKREKFEGSGIGLAHCKRIVEIHRGAINVESELGSGSKFKFSIGKHLA